MSDIVLGASIGGLAAFVIALPAIGLEIFKGNKIKDLPLIVEAKSFFDLRLSRTAAFAIGVYLHILMGVIFGGLYPLAVEKNWLAFVGAPFSLLTLTVYSLAVWLFFMLAVFPLFGFGWFGFKEGKLAWLEILLSLFLIAFLFWLAVPFYQPSYF